MIRCFIYRRKLSACVDAENKLETGLRRHIEICQPCHRFYEQELSIARGLAGGAAKERVTASPFLRARVMTAIDRAERAPSRPVLSTRLAWAGGLAAACVILFLMVHGPLAPHRAVAPADVHGVLKELTKLGKEIPDQQKLQQWSGTVDLPLDKEMRSLLHDARNVAQTLVVNFLPEDMARSAIGERSEQ